MTDKELIQKLGGATRVARMLGMTDFEGSRRVQNWTRRGIPSKIKLDFPALFLPADFNRRTKKK